MNITLLLAWRYLFARKSINAINLITGIAVGGLVIGTAALILVLSVFNGFEDLITGLYSKFNPDLKVTPLTGKTMMVDSALLQRLEQLPGVAAVAQSLEEVAFFEYDGKQDFGILKGVDANFNRVTHIDSTVQEGRYQLTEQGFPLAVLGLGMRNKLAVNVASPLTPLVVYLPKRRQTAGLEQQFRRGIAYPAGTFVIQQEIDQQYVLAPLEFARQLLGLPTAISALEIRLAPAADPNQVAQMVQELVGPELVVKTRYAQEETFLKLMQLEKWMSFAIVSLMLLLVAFNLIGALWMVVLEKKPDIVILKALGATDEQVRNVFLLEGILLSGLAVIIGAGLALAIYFAHKFFNIVAIPGDFIIESYPVGLRVGDFLIVALTVIAIGGLASWPPALRAQKVPATAKEA